MDARTASAKQMTELDSRTYLAWVGSLSRLMRELGPEVALPSSKPLDLRAHIAARAAAPV